MTPLDWIVLLVALQHVAELNYSHHNTRRLLAAGGVEYGAGHYPLFVLLHAAWLVSLWYAGDPTTPLNWWPLGALIGL